MSLFKRKQGKHVLQRVVGTPRDPFDRSPFNADRIGPGDPGWELFQRAMQSGGAVIGTYDSETGEIVSIEDAPRG